MDFSRLKNIFLVLFSGILFAISWPTYGFPLFIFFAFVPLLILEHELTINKSKFLGIKVFIYSFISFFIWNGVVYHWLFLVSENRFEAYLLPLFSNSILMSTVFWVYHKFKKNNGTFYGMIFFPCIWISFEYMHLNWELNWPWLNLGNAFAEYHQVIQWYEYTGTLGGSLWVLLINLLLFYIIKIWMVTRDKIYLKKLVLFTTLGIFIPIIISLIVYYNYKEKGKDKIEVVLIQPEVDPYNEKYERDSIDLVSEIVRLADTKITSKTDFIVAPETSFPGSGSLNLNNLNNSFLLNGIKNHFYNKNISLVTGVELNKIITKENEKEDSSFYNPYTHQWMNIYNSTLQLNNKDSIAYYHKSKLVPGVEGGFPYYNILKIILGKNMLNFGGTTVSLSKSKFPKVFTNSYNKAIVAPTICYESVFGEETAEFVKKGANVIFISTNDSWWKNSQGHKQLLVYAKLRAIENRRDIARSANSGISCFINQRGDIISSLPYETEGALKGSVFLNNKLTFYSNYGDYLAQIFLFILSILIAYSMSQFILKRFKNNF